jgi:hemoglobin/transferrin/lactoferrin receptor protein
MAMIMSAMGPMIVPNPDIGPERCNSFELDLRGDSQAGRNISVTAFYNNYTDFITDVTLPPDPDTGMMRFQYQNLQKVRIYGAEFKGGFTFLNNFAASASFAYAKGENLVENETLDSISPIKSVLALAYRDRDQWGMDMLCTLCSKNTKALIYPETGATGEPFQAAGYALLDMVAHINFKAKNNGWRAQAGIFNILDKTYWRWEDVRGFTVGDKNLPRYSQPGRNMSASLVYSWK